MAINPNDRYPGQTTAPSADYPYGGARNQSVPGDNTGTPLEADLVNDIFGFQQALLEEAGIVPSGTPETATASQYKDALDSIYQRKDAGYQLANIEIIDTAGAGTYTVPAGVRALRIIAIGGGGGGGGTGSGAGTACGGGGGGGSVAVRFQTVVPGSSYAYSVGNGGAGSTSGLASAGESTVWDSSGAVMTAGGGTGGTGMSPGSSVQTSPAGNSGAVSGTFDYVMACEPGRYGLRTGDGVLMANHGRGGTSAFGRVQNSSGGDGQGFGAGGNGNSTSSGTETTGGTGAPGAIIIEEYV